MNKSIDGAEVVKEEIMEGVTEYAEGLSVKYVEYDNGIKAIEARNEAGYNCTLVDVEELLEWIVFNKKDFDRRFAK